MGRGYRSPATAATLGIVSGMILSPANEVDIFRIFNGNDGAYDPAEVAVYRDNMQSYSATEPAIDLTSTSFLMWSRRSAHHASLWTDTPMKGHGDIDTWLGWMAIWFGVRINH